MSHTTTVKCVTLNDVAAIRKAVADLKKIGINCDLLEKEKPRAYYSGQLPVADFVIKLGRSKYDVGLYKEGKDDSYVVKADFFAGEIASQLGVPEEDGVPAEQSWLGKFYQAYGVRAVQNAAVRSGKTARITRSSNGSMSVLVS